MDVNEVRARKGHGPPLVMVTAYDAPGASMASEAGVDLILVGDSVAMAVLGYDDTLAIGVDEMVHHVGAVARAGPAPLVVADLPWMSFHLTPPDTVANAARLVRAGAQAVKLEGGRKRLPMIEAILDAEIPVMGHLGLTPQSVRAFGGFKVQARTEEAAGLLAAEAAALSDAGVFAIVLEGVPAPVATAVTAAVAVPTIGIGAGAGCDGQVLVLHDVLGIEDRLTPRFVRRYASVRDVSVDALRRYAADVRSGAFPDASESYGGWATPVRVLAAPADLAAELDAVRLDGATVGLVPTMGALHEGHASLVRRAAAECDVVTVSIFVNPLQFGPGEDLAAYPRRLETDVAAAAAAGATHVFAPRREQMYPAGFASTVHVAGVTERLEGAARPGHFDGVTTVVAKLFALAGRSRAYFGEKDFQQLQVVRRLACDLSLPVRVVGCPTVREADGLALSSRNAYLTPRERATAPVLHRALRAGASRVAEGGAVPAEVRAAMTELLATGPGVTVDYAEVVDPATLLAPVACVGPLRLLVAARLGRTRLIDNVGAEGPPGA